MAFNSVLFVSSILLSLPLTVLTGLTLFLGAALSATLIVCLLPLFQRYALARPNARSSHLLPTPQGGGLAILSAGYFLFFVLQPLFGPQNIPLSFLIVMGLSLSLMILGGIDDVKPLPAILRLIFQSIAIVIIIWQPDLVHRLMPVAIPLEIETGLIALSLIWFVNLVNFMDGIDLITSAQMLPLWGMIAAFAFIQQDLNLGLLSLCLIGALLGFVPFNWPPARLFLGDMGSLPLGLMSGWALLQFAYAYSLLLALVPVLYYLTDATLTLFYRLKRREKIWQAHRSHYYQRAHQNGHSVLNIVGLIGVTNFVLIIITGIAIWLRASFDVLVVDFCSLLVAYMVVRKLLQILMRPVNLGSLQPD